MKNCQCKIKFCDQRKKFKCGGVSTSLKKVETWVDGLYMLQIRTPLNSVTIANQIIDQAPM